MSYYDDPERRYSCLSEPIQVLHRHPHSLSLISIQPNVYDDSQILQAQFMEMSLVMVIPLTFLT